MKNHGLIWWVYEDTRHVSNIGISDTPGSFCAIGAAELIDKSRMVSAIGVGIDDVMGSRFISFVGGKYGYSASTLGAYYIGSIE